MGYPWARDTPQGYNCQMRRIALSSTPTVYAVHGMTCAHCERAVTEEVAAVAGVSAVRADAAAGTVTVTAAGEIDESALGAAVAEAGYVLAGRA